MITYAISSAILKMRFLIQENVILMINGPLVSAVSADVLVKVLDHLQSQWWSCLGPGGRLNKKDGLTRYGDSHVKDKTS